MDENLSSTVPTRPTFRRRIIAAFLLLVLGFVFLCAGILVFIRVGLRGESVASFAAHRLGRSLDKDIYFSSAELSWLSLERARISLSDLKVREKPGAPLLLHVPKVVIEINALPFLAGYLQINRLEFFRPTFFLPQIRQSTPAHILPDWHTLAFRLYPVIRRLELIQGRVVLGNSLGSRYVERVLFSKIHLNVRNLTISGAEDVAINGIAVSGERAGRFEISGGVESTPFSGEEWRGHIKVRMSACPILPFRALAAYTHHDLPFSAGILNGTAEVTGRTLAFRAKGDLALYQAVLLPGRIFRDKAPLDKGALRFSLERLNNDLHIDVSEATLPGLNLSGRATIGGLFTTNPSLALSLRRADLDLQKFFPFIPVNLMHKEDRERLIEAGLKGHVLVTGGAWTGKISDLFRERNWQGSLMVDAYLDKVSGFIPVIGVPVWGAMGQIKLNANEMLFKGVSLTVGSSPIVLNGLITNLRTSPTSDLFITLSARAEDLRPIIENKLISRHLEPWAGWITEPQGGIAVTLDLKGRLNHPSMKGRVVLDDFQCRFSGLPLPIKKVNGTLRFRTSGVTFSAVKGMIGDSAAEASGEIFPEKMDVSGQLKIAPNDLKKLSLMPTSWVVSSHIPLSVKLTGSPSAMNFSTRLDLKGNGLRIDPIIKKKPGVPLLVEASGFRDQAGVKIEEAYLILQESRISAKATFDNQGKIVASINLPPKGVPTGTLVPILDPTLEFQPGGRIDGDAVIRLGPNKFQDLSVDANVALNHVSLRIMGMHKRMEGITGTIRWRGKSIKLSMERARVGSSLASGTASIIGISHPKLDVVLDFSFMDTTDFTEPPGYVSNVTWSEWIRTNTLIRFLARSTGIGTLKIAKGKTEWRTFSDFTANLEGNGGLIRSPTWQMNFADGTLQGSALFDIRTNTSKPLTLDFQGDHLKMERMMLFDPDKTQVEGKVLTEGHLEWKSGPKRENGGVYKVGTVEVRVHDGVIHRFEILSKLFSLVNLGSIMRGRLPDILSGGLPFYHLTWNMTVFDDKWKIKDLKLSSDATRINASGMYFSSQKRVDFKVDVSPLVGLDTIVSGLFGNLLTKDGKILTTTFRVRGFYEHPDIRLEPFENIRSAE
ncbi:MAG: AsmA-like C-terminal domain-containing protein [Desulfomonilaceae bacterium]